MCSDVAKTHKKVSLRHKTTEASIDVTISGAAQMGEFKASRSFYFGSVQPEDWHMEINFGDPQISITVSRKAESVAHVLEGCCVVSLPHGKVETEVPEDYISADSDGEIELLSVAPFDTPSEDFEISCRIVYSQPFVDEDVVCCELPTVERLSNRLSSTYEDLFLTGIASDIVFLVGEEKIPAHKAVLSAQIPYFGKMMSSGMEEAQTGKIKIEDAEPAVFKQVLRHVYCGKLPEDLRANAPKILPLADKFDLPCLKEACVHWMERDLKVANVIPTLVAADLFRCENLKRKCLKRLNEWKSSMDPKEFECLQPRLLIEVIKA